MKLTNEERLIMLETKLEAVRDDLTDIKAGQHELLQEFKRHCEVAENKFATKSELSTVKKWLFALSGSLITFLVWVLEQYLSAK